MEFRKIRFALQLQIIFALHKNSDWKIRDLKLLPTYKVKKIVGGYRLTRPGHTFGILDSELS